MAKDPAILFYTSDFLTGTILMTHEQVGIYIRLLCVLHQHGGTLDLEAFNAFIGTHEIIRSKFVIEDGTVFNQRLMDEMSRRSKKSSSLSINAKKRWEKHCKSNAKASNLHMPIENENANENEDAIKKDRIVKERKFTAPTLEEVEAYKQDRNSIVESQGFIDFYASKGWMVGKNKMKDWKAAFRNAEGWDRWGKAPVQGSEAAIAKHLERLNLK